MNSSSSFYETVFHDPPYGENRVDSLFSVPSGSLIVTADSVRVIFRTADGMYQYTASDDGFPVVSRVDIPDNSVVYVLKKHGESVKDRLKQVLKRGLSDNSQGIVTRVLCEAGLICDTHTLVGDWISPCTLPVKRNTNSGSVYFVQHTLSASIPDDYLNGRICMNRYSGPFVLKGEFPRYKDCQPKQDITELLPRVSDICSKLHELAERLELGISPDGSFDDITQLGSLKIYSYMLDPCWEYIYTKPLSGAAKPIVLDLLDDTEEILEDIPTSSPLYGFTLLMFNTMLGLLKSMSEHVLYERVTGVSNIAVPTHRSLKTEPKSYIDESTSDENFICGAR